MPDQSRPWRPPRPVVAALGPPPDLPAGRGGGRGRPGRLGGAPGPRWTAGWSGKLDLYVRRETGLGFQAERLEVHPLPGPGPAPRARRWAATCSGPGCWRWTWSGPPCSKTPHIRRILVEDPTLNLDRGAWPGSTSARARPGARPPQVRLDRLEIRNGLAQVREPAWGLRHGDFRFQVTGTGRGQPAGAGGRAAISLGQGGDRFQGGLVVLSANLTTGRSRSSGPGCAWAAQRLAFNGGLPLQGALPSLAASGHLDLAEAQRLASPGPVHRLRPAGLPGQGGRHPGQPGLEAAPSRPPSFGPRDCSCTPGGLTAAAQGTPSEIRLERLTWASLDGRLQASGNWSARSGDPLQADASAIPLAPVAGYTRAGFLKDLTASFSGVAKLPAGLPDAPWAPSSLESLSFHGTGQFIQDGQRVGGMGVDLERGRFTTPMLDLDLAELEFHGKASGTVGRHGLASVEAEASAATDAADVAGMLMAWDIGMTDDAGKRTALDMSGAARIEAQAGWSAQGGMQLKGRVELQAPRWHGATGRPARGRGDHRPGCPAGFGHRAGQGRRQGLRGALAHLGRPAQGRGCDRHVLQRPSACRCAKGLRAADLGDLPLDGTGSGWVRLHGPFDAHHHGRPGAWPRRPRSTACASPRPRRTSAWTSTATCLRATDVRVADSLAHLGDARQVPDGPLALQGSMDMDTRARPGRWPCGATWTPASWAFPGPAFQARVDARLEGPLVAPLGPIQMPQGSASFTQGRADPGRAAAGMGLEGRPPSPGGNLKLSLGLAGKPTRVVTLHALAAGAGPDERRPGAGLRTGIRRHREAGRGTHPGFPQGHPVPLPCPGRLDPEGPALAGPAGPVQRPVRRVQPGPVPARHLHRGPGRDGRGPGLRRPDLAEAARADGARRRHRHQPARPLAVQPRGPAGPAAVRLLQPGQPQDHPRPGAPAGPVQPAGRPAHRGQRPVQPQPGRHPGWKPPWTAP